MFRRRCHKVKGPEIKGFSTLGVEGVYCSWTRCIRLGAGRDLQVGLKEQRPSQIFAYTIG